ncbi:adenosine kinase [Desulfacinum hydrothermale DSM 13146]|uniref:Adenosine kinase n=1 Tax=Desulfacinum hydrothermale DSM 13146 TaxID=1121390 RepID=A0A1W1WYF6_9BACT|nr:carbohydrate kinase family protein [Desulfacinum hydrothermale]SMC16600.1 adenosine kinase [Desulfacinum hydrothermale DSM 13146]
MNIFISGSLAYDRIMDFPGHFADHILPNKIHMLNVCFNINGLVEKFGGTAGNIAYTLALLGEKPAIVAAAGDDFDRYERWLDTNGLPRTWIKRIPDVLTAGAYITTDLNDNQITAFNPGAMAFEADLPTLDDGALPALVHIGPGNKNDMQGLAERCRRAQVPFVFDPGQSLNIWTGEEIARAVQGALCFISNEYELSHFLKMTGWRREDLERRVSMVVVTRGPEGSVLRLEGQETLVPAAVPRQVVDPTGAGDAYRGGFLKGLAAGKDPLVCCQLGSVAASFAVECHGTQEHVFSAQDFGARYQAHFGPLEGDLLSRRQTKD